MNINRLLKTGILAGFFSAQLYAQVPFDCIVVDSAISAPAKPYGKAIGDVSGDGQPDLFISSADDDGMHWYQYPDWKKHAIRTHGSWSEDCQLADIDNDGDNDVVNGNKQGLYWYENPLNAGGSIVARNWIEHAIGSDGTNIHDLEIADLNGDGKPDVAVRYEKENQQPVCIFLQMNPDEWMVLTNTNISHKEGEGLALGDLDGDADVDMALGNIWIENNGRGTGWDEHAYAKDMPEQMILKIADINQDGNPDIIAAPQSSQAGKFAWYAPGKDEGHLWIEHTIKSNVTRMHGLAAGDFNNDGYGDIHTSIRHDHPGTRDHVSIWLSNGNPEPDFTEQVLATKGSHFSKIGDVDQDGDLDIFGANWSGPVDHHANIMLWRNNTQIKVIIDADTGNEIDDIIAITRALKADNLDVLGLAAEQWKHQLSWNINTMQESWELNNRILESLSIEGIPSLKGSEMILGKPWGGEDPRKSEASDFIIEKALEMPDGKKLIVICTGPVTNVASALLLKPEIIDKLAVYFVGTRYDFEKNAWNKNEFNVRNDLNAFDALLNADGLELHILPANISGDIIFTAVNTLPRLNSQEPIEDMILKRWAERVKDIEQWIMWDLGIIEAVIHPEWANQQSIDTPPENTLRKIHVYSKIDVEAMIEDFWKCLER